MTYSDAMKNQESLLRDQMDALLKTAPAAHQDVFRAMYNYKGLHKRDVDGVPANKLDWAFMQIENGLKSAAQASRPRKVLE